MKNPCDDDCIVKAMCTEVCDEKTNYGNLVKQAKLEHESIFFTKEGTKNLQFKKSYLHWKSIVNNHMAQVIVINTRAHDINKIR